MPLTIFNLMGIVAGLIGLVIGLSTMLLVAWQAPSQHDNQLMVLYMAAVAAWGLAAVLLNLSGVVGWDPRPFHQTLSLMVGLHTYATFCLAARFARLPIRLPLGALLVGGALTLLVGTPLMYRNELIVLSGMTSDGLYHYQFTPLSLPFVALLVVYPAATLAIVWRHRRGRAGQLLTGMVLSVGAVVLNSVPSLGAYPVDVPLLAIASLLFARSILNEQLFAPLTRLNDELTASNARLTTLTADLRRTADELRIARDAAEAASVAKSQFLANMSHELRTPLTSIIGYSDLMRIQMRETGSVSASDIDVVSQSGKHLLALINDVLDLAKIEAGRIEFDLVCFPVAPLVDELVQAVRPLADANGNTLVVRCGDDGFMVGDITKLRQMLLNLLNNAIKFTRGGTVTLDVRRTMVDRRELVAFEVQDTGIGMTEEQIGRLFQGYTQADASIGRRFGGTGLGLALSRHLCRLMGGDITVASQAGVGSVFTATVPSDLHGRPLEALDPPRPVTLELHQS